MIKQYDQAYFQHWYRRSDIGGPQRLARKVALAVSCAPSTTWSVPSVRCSTSAVREGAWRAPLLKLRPKLRYLGFDSSEFAISKYGPRRNLHYAHFGDFAQLRPCPPVDLLICADVLHYLPSRELQRGLPGLAELCGGVAFLETFTREDEFEGDHVGFQSSHCRLVPQTVQCPWPAVCRIALLAVSRPRG